MARWDPFEEIRRLEEEIDSIFSQFWKGTRFARLPSPVSSRRELVSPEGVVFSPACDVIEREKDIIVKCDLPGVDKKDVKIKVNEDSVSISGEVKKEKKEKEENYYMEERIYGSFQKIVPLPSEVNPEEAKAKFENGVLEIVLPKVVTGKKTKEITL